MSEHVTMDDALIEDICRELARRFGRKGKLAFNPRPMTCYRISCAIEEAVEHLPDDRRASIVERVFTGLRPHIEKRSR